MLVLCLTIDHHLQTFANMYLGLGGLKLNTPDINEKILVCFPTGKPSIYSWKAEIADLCKFLVLYSLPQLKNKVKYSIIDS